MNRFFLFLATAALVALAGCASSPKTGDPTASDVDGNGNKVSAIPWNKPQSWEGGGMMGAAMGGN